LSILVPALLPITPIAIVGSLPIFGLALANRTGA
jgi:hypothetical protein